MYTVPLVVLFRSQPVSIGMPILWIYNVQDDNNKAVAYAKRSLSLISLDSASVCRSRRIYIIHTLPLMGAARILVVILPIKSRENRG